MGCIVHGRCPVRWGMVSSGCSDRTAGRRWLLILLCGEQRLGVEDGGEKGGFWEWTLFWSSAVALVAMRIHVTWCVPWPLKPPFFTSS